MFNINIPLSSAASTIIELTAGQILFVAGANGSGKSSLIQNFYSQAYGRARKISAHRQTWFASNTLDLTPQGKRNTEQNMMSGDGN